MINIQSNTVRYLVDAGYQDRAYMESEYLQDPKLVWDFSHNYHLSLNTNYHVKFRNLNGLLQYKQWQEGAPEPDWMIEVEDHDLGEGKVGMASWYAAGVVKNINVKYSQEDEDALTGRWLLMMYGTKYCEDSRFPEPYCVFDDVDIVHEGSWLMLCSDRLQAEGSDGDLECPCDGATFDCLYGFPGRGKIVLSSEHCLGDSSNVIMTGNTHLFGRLISGEFRQVLEDSFSCIIECRFIAIRVGGLSDE